MKFLKKLSSVLLMSAMIFSLAACSSSSNSSSTSESSSSSASSESALSEDSSSSAEETATVSSSEVGKTLVVYYSASGNTARVANNIAESAGADLFEITPTEPYTSEDLNWTDDNSRVSREHDDESLRDVPLTTTEVENWDDYDTVFIGYPIWWGIAAWPVNNFVKNNDFTGKTVIPFATSSSSGMGQSGQLLEEMAGTGEWQEGQRFSSGASESDVADWVNSLEISD